MLEYTFDSGQLIAIHTLAYTNICGHICAYSGRRRRAELKKRPDRPPPKPNRVLTEILHLDYCFFSKGSVSEGAATIGRSFGRVTRIHCHIYSIWYEYCRRRVKLNKKTRPPTAYTQPNPTQNLVIILTSVLTRFCIRGRCYNRLARRLHHRFGGGMDTAKATEIHTTNLTATELRGRCGRRNHLTHSLARPCPKTILIIDLWGYVNK